MSNRLSSCAHIVTHSHFERRQICVVVGRSWCTVEICCVLFFRRFIRSLTSDSFPFSVNSLDASAWHLDDEMLCGDLFIVWDEIQAVAVEEEEEKLSETKHIQYPFGLNDTNLERNCVERSYVRNSCSRQSSLNGRSSSTPSTSSWWLNCWNH